MLQILKYLYYSSYCLFRKCSPTTGYEPFYEPHKWNSDFDIKYSHNCYAYALNDINKNLQNICRNKFCKHVNPQPGHYCKSNLNHNTCYQVKLKLKCDNPYIIDSDFSTRCPKYYYKIGLTTQQNLIYHFYRQNSYGLWDHKDGGLRTNFYDSDEQVIVNPELSKKSFSKYRNYDIWCGYFCAPHNDFIRTNISRLRNSKRLY